MSTVGGDPGFGHENFEQLHVSHGREAEVDCGNKAAECYAARDAEACTVPGRVRRRARVKGVHTRTLARSCFSRR